MPGLTDKPIENVSYDTLGMKKYADCLSEFIMTCDTPMTISIQGEWGCGKTSMMKMIRENICADTKTVWFNTWQFSQFNMEENLATSLLSSFLSQIGGRSQTIRSIGSLAVGSIKAVLDTIISNRFPYLSVDSVISELGQQNINYITQLEKLKTDITAEIDAVLHKNGKERIVVFIDDLDRLNPARAVEVLEIINIFFDCKSCVFVLAIDHSIITRGVKEKYGEDISDKKGRNFFDKIIQLPFTIPVAQFDNYGYVKELISQLKEDIPPSEAQEYTEIIKKSIGADNPRELKRLFNTYILTRKILKGTYKETGFVNEDKLLFATVCMQMEFEELYEYLVINSEFLSCFLIWELSTSIGMENQRKFETIIKCDSNDKIKRMKEFMSLYGDMLNLTLCQRVIPHNLQDSDTVAAIEERENSLQLKSLKNIIDATKISSVNILENKEKPSAYIMGQLNSKILDATRLSIETKFNVQSELYVGKQPETKSSACCIIHFPGKELYYKLCYTLYSNTHSLQITLHANDATESEKFFDVFPESPFSEKSEKIGGCGYTYAKEVEGRNSEEQSECILKYVDRAVLDVMRFLQYKK